MRNSISLLGFLGLLGVLGFVVNNPGFWGFFGFFGFFGFARVVPDEMFVANMNRAARNAFFSGVVVYAASVIWGAFSSFEQAYAHGFPISFTVQIVVFSISLTVYEQGGARQ